MKLHRHGDRERLIERLLAEIAVLRAGNEVLRRMNGKLTSMLATLAEAPSADDPHRLQKHDVTRHIGA